MNFSFYLKFLHYSSPIRPDLNLKYCKGELNVFNFLVSSYFLFLLTHGRKRFEDRVLDG